MRTKSPEEIQISAGALAAAEGCPRCLWLDYHGHGPPSKPFPGVVQQLDSVIKDYTRQFFGKDSLPPLFAGLEGTLIEIRTTLKTLEPKSGVTLTGKLDDLLREPQGTYRVIDYKSGKPGEEKARLYYQHQMDGYAYLVEANGHRPVRDAVLIFFEPIKGEALARGQVDFRITPQPLPTNPGRVPGLLQRARDILAREKPPESDMECRWCQWVKGMGRV